MSSTGHPRPGAGDSDARSRRVKPQPRARATRLAILTAAAEHFARNGYHATSLDGVLADSGGTKGALYFHFASKDALARAVIAVMARGWGDLREHVSARGLDPLSALLAMADEVVARLVDNPIARGGIRLVNDRPLSAQDTPWHYGFAERDVLALLTQAAQAGLLQTGIEPALLARQVVAVVAGHRQVCESMGGRHDLGQRVEEAWDLLLPAVATEAWLAAWRATRSR
ncbi:MAG: TetR/AcrR family transcriptional regulator [Pseudonocardiales bacterium]|nr:TetR/AcrR family transcriptional regulator [Pseudonocardiales bacterium]MBV9028958.1 TetR/AcrR family transcriptional regulator [Pseudonocardiales bacterium]MBW0010810.1 TetR/AcrR family transcriptional regulator [Pseudonocardiales bacterium]